MLNDKAKNNYLKFPYHCPYCDGDDITSGLMHDNTGFVEQNVVCNECGKRWKDIHGVVDIIEEENW